MFTNVPIFPQTASTIAHRIDALYYAALGVSIFFSTLIAVLILYFMVKYQRRAPDEVGRGGHGSMQLEIAWIVIPLFITLFLFAWGAQVFFAWARPPAAATEYFGVGKQWMWKFQHPEGTREIDELHIPMGQPVKIILTSEDVIHSLYFPAFRVKSDLMPGRYLPLWFEPTRTGTFHLFCAEYCGTWHSRMVGRVVVMEPHEYETWLSGGGGRSMVAAGEDLFQSMGCATCHREDTRARGPQLAGLFGRPTPLRDGRTVIADENYLRESIVNPTAKVVAGYAPIMPTFQGQVTEEGLMQLIQYIKSLHGEGSAPETAPRSAPAPEGALP